MNGTPAELPNWIELAWGSLCFGSFLALLICFTVYKVIDRRLSHIEELKRMDEPEEDAAESRIAHGPTREETT